MHITVGLLGFELRISLARTDDLTDQIDEVVGEADLADRPATRRVVGFAPQVTGA